MKLKKVFVLLYLIMMLSCQSNRDFFTVGTSASMHNLDSFPDPAVWSNLIEGLSYDIDAPGSILWLVGAYSSNGIKMNFPGNDNIKSGLYFSEIDYNEQFLSQFDKNGVKVYLMLEPGTASVTESIETILTRYGSHKSVSGIALDLEWLFNSNNGNVTAKEIEMWLELTLSHNKSYKLILKHWNRRKIEQYPDNSVIYIQDMQGISELDEIITRNITWSRYFYPSYTGLELGYSDDFILWNGENHPVYRINEIINVDSDRKSSIFWSESSLQFYLP